MTKSRETLLYPVDLTPDEGGFVVTFPDVPDAITQGDDVEHALAMAAEALESAIDLYFDAGRPSPLPSKPKRGQDVVELPGNVAARVGAVELTTNQGEIEGLI